MQFSEHLEATEATFEGRRAVIDGLDVTVEVFRKGSTYSYLPTSRDPVDCSTYPLKFFRSSSS